MGGVGGSEQPGDRQKIVEGRATHQTGVVELRDPHDVIGRLDQTGTRARHIAHQQIPGAVRVLA